MGGDCLTYAGDCDQGPAPLWVAQRELEGRRTTCRDTGYRYAVNAKGIKEGGIRVRLLFGCRARVERSAQVAWAGNGDDAEGVVGLEPGDEEALVVPAADAVENE